MKKLIALSVVLCCAILVADDPIVAVTLREDGSTNTWTQSELQAALGLINRMYKREIGTDAGRRRWHGDRIGQYVLPTGETNAVGREVFVRVDLYADGFVMTNRAVRAKNSIIRDPEAAAKAAAEAKRQAEEARRAWEQANLPPDLAALRALQRLAGETNEVTVIVSP